MAFVRLQSAVMSSGLSAILIATHKYNIFIGNHKKNVYNFSERVCMPRIYVCMLYTGKLRTHICAKYTDTERRARDRHLA